jgi:hypothetical protein
VRETTCTTEVIVAPRGGRRRALTGQSAIDYAGGSMFTFRHHARHHVHHRHEMGGSSVIEA